MSDWNDGPVPKAITSDNAIAVEPMGFAVTLVRDEVRSGGLGPPHVALFIYVDGKLPLFVRVRSHENLMFLVQHLLEKGGAAWPAALGGEA